MASLLLAPSPSPTVGRWPKQHILCLESEVPGGLWAVGGSAAFGLHPETRDEVHGCRDRSGTLAAFFSKGTQCPRRPRAGLTAWIPERAGAASRFRGDLGNQTGVTHLRCPRRRRWLPQFRPAQHPGLRAEGPDSWHSSGWGRAQCLQAGRFAGWVRFASSPKTCKWVSVSPTSHIVSHLCITEGR